MKAWNLLSGNYFPELPLDANEKSLDDATRRLPQGVYTTFRTFGGSKKVIGFQDHLDRLYGPALSKGITPVATELELRAVMRELLTVYYPNEVRIRICLAFIGKPGQIFIIIDGLLPLSKDVYEKGVRISTTHVERVNPRIKSTTFIEISTPERNILHEKDIFEGLIVRNGRIFEGLTSNFYAIKNSTVITARVGILLGVTRRLVLRLVRSARIDVEYRSLRIDEIGEISEAFLTSSSRGVVPVISIDGIPIGEGDPGKVSQILMCMYDRYVLEKADVI
jgi:branched-chain amino acid aminotransferase